MRCKTPQEMNAAIVANMPGKTGHTLEEWVDLVKAQGLVQRKEGMSWLKSEHNVGHVTAQIIMDTVAKASAEAPADNDPLTEQYAGPKAALRPVYERLNEIVARMDGEVRTNVCKTYVSLMRKRQFAVIQPTTKSRVDLGLVLPDIEPNGRLRRATSVGGGRVTHRIELQSPEQIDDEVVSWLKLAYEADA